MRDRRQIESWSGLPRLRGRPGGHFGLGGDQAGAKPEEPGEDERSLPMIRT